MQATQLWSHWQDLLQPCAAAFTAPGFRRFTEWITALALNVEEHTITQSLVGLDRTQDWKALETFAEYGAWDQPTLEHAIAGLIEQAPGRLWYGYHVWAGDDTKVHRSSKKVWGTCTYHEYTARCPNRATTVRAHNWVVLGALLPRPSQPAWFLPHTGRLYFRRSQLPAGETFRTKCELLVELLRNEAHHIAGRHLGVFDGAFAVRSVVRPLTQPEVRQPRVEFLTRLRGDARLHARAAAERRRHQRGPKPKWGPKLPPPRQGGRWPGAWQHGQAWLYGRWRTVRYKEVVCLWRVAGPARVVKAVVAEVEGYRKRFTLVSSVTDLSGLQLVELFCARFREEQTFHDVKEVWGVGQQQVRNVYANLGAMAVNLLWYSLVEAWAWLRSEEELVARPAWDEEERRPSHADKRRALQREILRQEIRAAIGERPHWQEFQDFTTRLLDLAA
jgi:hypothetical protein